MKPLEEYMLFTKQGSETVRATILAGVRSAQCAVFHAQPRGLDPPRNDSVVRNHITFITLFPIFSSQFYNHASTTLCEGDLVRQISVDLDALGSDTGNLGVLDIG